MWQREKVKYFGIRVLASFVSYSHYMGNYTRRRLYKFGTQMFRQEQMMWKIVVNNVKIIMLKWKACVRQSKYQSHFLFIAVKISFLTKGLCDVKKVNIGVFVPRNENYGCFKPNETLTNTISAWQSIVEIIIKKKNVKLGK